MASILCKQSVGFSISRVCVWSRLFSTSTTASTRDSLLHQQPQQGLRDSLARKQPQQDPRDSLAHKQPQQDPRDSLAHKQPQPHLVDFDSPQGATAGKTSYEVARGWLVFKLFTFDSLVDNSLKYYNLSKKYLGLNVTEKVLKVTVFGQFIGGLDERESRKTVRHLADQGVCSIWNYSVEKDLDDEEDITTEVALRQKEKDFKQINDKYLKSIKMAASCTCNRPAKFAAVKLTPIVNPHLVKKLNEMIHTSESVFSSLATKAECITDRVIPRDTLYKELPEVQNQGSLGTNDVDILKWNKHFNVAGNIDRFQSLSERAKVNPDKLKLTELEVKQLDSFLDKLDAIGKCASKYRVRVLVDAEQTYFQRLFDHLVLYYLMPQYNRERTVIYNTVQAYLKHSFDNVLVSLATATDFKVKCGLKLVRGAYLYQEQQLALKLGHPSPTHSSKDSVDKSYNSCLTHLLEQVSNDSVATVVATHNRHSVELALRKMQDLDLSPSDGRVCFGQILGMADHLTYPLATAGFIANKVIAYGSLDDVVPFLSRRAQENRGLMESAQIERSLYTHELRRRLWRR